MTKMLVLAAIVGVSASAAGACEFQRSAEATKVDPTVVASVATPDMMSMSMPVAAPAEQEAIPAN